MLKKSNSDRLDISVKATTELRKILKKSVTYLSGIKNYNYMLFTKNKNIKYNIKDPLDEEKFINNLALIRDSKNWKYLEKEFGHFNQKPPEIKPLIVDIDLSRQMPYDYEFTKKETIVNDKMISELSKSYNTILEKIYGDTFTNDKKNSLAFISVRPKKDYIVSKKGIKSIKDGMHIVFPNVVCNKKVQNVIRNEVLKIAFEEGTELFEFRSVRDKVIDKQIIDSAFWCLYGQNYCKIGKNGKREWKPKYTLTHITISDGIILPKTHELYKQSNGFYLKLLNIRGRKNNNKLKIIYKPKTPDIKYEKPSFNNDMSDKDVKFWKNILEKLNPDRYGEYDLWMKTGLKISSAFKQSEKMYDVWTELCDKSEEQHNWHNHGHYSDIWKKADGRWTEETIMNLLRNDNIEEYKKIINNNVQMAIKNSKERFTDACVAKINAKILGDDHAVSYESNPKGNLYIFKKSRHIWVLMNNDIFLHKALQDIVLDVWKEALKAQIKARAEWQASNIEENIKTSKKNKKQETPFDDSIEDIRRICREIQTTNKIPNYTRFLKMRLSLLRDKFEEKLNSNPNLFACANGILDFSDGIFTFRDGRQEDFISIASPLEWTPYNKDDEMTKEMHKFFEDIYVDKDIRDFIMSLFAMCLSINDWDNRMFFMLGEGSNGKTQIFNIIKLIFGYNQYYANVASEIFTQKAKRGAPTPEVMLMKYKRIISVNEIDDAEDVVLNGKAVLQFSGGADIAGCRRLNENSDHSHFRLQGWIFFQTNEIPKCSGDGKNYRRRLRIIPHKTTFMYKDDEEYDKDNKYHKFIDTSLSLKIPIYAEKLFSYMVHIYKNKFMGKKQDLKNLNEPKAVKEATNSYFAEINKMSMFLKANLVQKTDSKISMAEIYNKYVNWMREYNTDEKCISKSRFIKNMKGRLKKYVTKNGLTLKGFDFKE